MNMSIKRDWAMIVSGAIIFVMAIFWGNWETGWDVAKNVIGIPIATLFAIFLDSDLEDRWGL